MTICAIIKVRECHARFVKFPVIIATRFCCWLQHNYNTRHSSSLRAFVVIVLHNVRAINRLRAFYIDADNGRCWIECFITRKIIPLLRNYYIVRALNCVHAYFNVYMERLIQQFVKLNSWNFKRTLLFFLVLKTILKILSWLQQVQVKQ